MSYDKLTGPHTEVNQCALAWLHIRLLGLSSLGTVELHLIFPLLPRLVFLFLLFTVLGDALLVLGEPVVNLVKGGDVLLNKWHLQCTRVHTRDTRTRCIRTHVWWGATCSYGVLTVLFLAVVICTRSTGANTDLPTRTLLPYWSR